MFDRIPFGTSASLGNLFWGTFAFGNRVHGGFTLGNFLPRNNWTFVNGLRVLGGFFIGNFFLRNNWTFVNGLRLSALGGMLVWNFFLRSFRFRLLRRVRRGPLSCVRRFDVANERRDAVTVQELDPEDLLGGQPVVGTLDLNEMAHLEVRVPQGEVWKS